MASAVLYPPIIDGYIPAIAGNDSIIVPFVFSKFNAAAAQTLIDEGDPSQGIDPLTMQATVCESISNQSTVNTQTDTGYTDTGIILDLAIRKDETNNYYIEIPRANLYTLTIGKKYKIQLRLSGKKYSESTEIKQADWLVSNASFFSEWSTICILKYTSIPSIQFKNPVSQEVIGTFSEQILGTYKNENIFFFGNFLSLDKEEYLINYQIKIYTDNDRTNLFDDSGVIEVNFNQKDIFNYEFKKEVNNNTHYYIDFIYCTNNYYQKTLKFDITISLNTTACDLELDTIDFNDYSNYTSISKEEDDARVGLFVKLKQGFSAFSNGIYRIKRYSSKDLFTQSDIIGTFVLNTTNKTSGIIGPFYDSSIESGVIYQYSIQKMINVDNQTYTASNKTGNLIRNFDFSYLISYNKRLKKIQQLKLAFDQTLENFSITTNDSQINTLGSKYPYVIRNGNTYYKQFPVNGLISLNMDENNLFIDKATEIYGDQNIQNFYEAYNKKHKINLWNDVFYERKFREYVLDFLYADNIKLYKSPTEGNLLVRITNVSCNPKQELNKMIYSFSSSAYEIADMNLDNCEKYKIVNRDFGEIKDADIH